MKLSTLNPYLYSFLMAGVLLLSSCEDNESDTTPTPTTTEYTVTFDAGTGGTLTSTATVKVKSGEKVAEPTAPTRDGFTFSEWQTADGTAFDFATQTITEDITLYTQWGYNLNFTLNGGQLPDGALNPTVVPENTTPTLPVITKPNAIFIDWFTDANFTTLYTPADLTGNLTLYAQWSPAKYSIAFELDGGKLPDGTSNPQPIVDNTVPMLPTPTQDGAVFVNWYNEAERTTVYTAAELTTNITLYAQWEYNIMLDLNGGTLPTDAQNPQVVEAGSRLSRESLPQPTKSTYRFLGWYTEAGLTTKYKPEVINAGRTLYARWETKFTVAFDLDGGALSGRSGDMISKTYREGLVPTLPTDPTKDSQSFAGWFTDSGLNNAYTPAALTTNIDLYAQWVDPPFTVSVAIDGNTVAGTISEASNTITFLLPAGIAASDLSALTPSFTEATSSPTTAQDFTGPVTYAVTKTGATQATTYSVKLRVRDRTQLKTLTNALLTAADLNFIDTSLVTDMSDLFFNKPTFNGAIGAWDVSNVTTMNGMFSVNAGGAFNQAIGAWDVSQVKDMGTMFTGLAVFDQDIGDWDVSNVEGIRSMFNDAAAFNQDIGYWDVSKVESMRFIFSGASAFNQDIGYWDVSKVEDMQSMFQDASVFNQDIGAWDVSQVGNMQDMFNGASAFNQDISGWNVGLVTFFSNIFSGATAMEEANKPSFP